LPGWLSGCWMIVWLVVWLVLAGCVWVLDAVCVMMPSRANQKTVQPTAPTHRANSSPEEQTPVQQPTPELPNTQHKRPGTTNSTAHARTHHIRTLSLAVDRDIHAHNPAPKRAVRSQGSSRVRSSKQVCGPMQLSETFPEVGPRANWASSLLQAGGIDPSVVPAPERAWLPEVKRCSPALTRGASVKGLAGAGRHM